MLYSFISSSVFEIINKLNHNVNQLSIELEIKKDTIRRLIEEYRIKSLEYSNLVNSLYI
jgi:regulator of replication initiation timing